jgi:acyl carrier protein
LNKKNNNKISEEKNKSQKKIFGFGIPNIVGNLFGKDNDKTDEEKIQEEQDKKRKKEIYEEIYNQILIDVVIKLIKDFIVHFSCFSVESFDVLDIITNVTNKYKVTIEEKKIKYLLAIFNSNMYSIKNTKFRKINKEDININNNGSRFDKFMNQNYLKGNSNKIIKLL